MDATNRVDVVIAGGGPAGLSAALALGRSRKRVLVCDRGEPRNARAKEMHNFITRDGVSPAEFRALARQELARYETVAFAPRTVVGATRGEAGFTVTFDDDSSVLARRIILASGVVDLPSEIEGLPEQWGRHAFQCPYCHGWEARDKEWGVILPAEAMVDWALLLLCWTPRVTAFTGGGAFSEAALQRLRSAGITVETGPIERVVGRGEGEGVQLEGIRLRSGQQIPCDILFVRPVQQAVPLVAQLGLAVTEQGYAVVNDQRESSVPGVFVAGDAGTPMQGAIMAAASGTMAGAMINHGLAVEDATRPREPAAR